MDQSDAVSSMERNARPDSRTGWRPSGFFVLRTPALPLATLTALSADLRAPAAPSEGAELDVALAADRARTSDALRALVRTDPYVREALFLASPSLDAGIESWLRGEEAPRAKGVAEIVLRYIARMSARATPFGLFSGSSVGSLGDETRLVVAPRAEYRRHGRLDMHYLDALCEALNRSRAVRAALRYVPSTGLYATSTHYRYAEAHTDKATRARSYHLVTVDRTSYLDATLARARDARAHGGATLQELSRALSESDERVSREEADAFVDELVDAQILTPELEPAITGDEAIEAILRTLSSRGLDTIAAPLALARDELRAMDAQGSGHAPARYRALAERLAPLPVSADSARLFQVDLYKPGRATLGRDVMEEITRGVDLLTRIGAREEPESLKRFREAFEARYETREVPLALALDDEAGLGFGLAAGGSEPSPLLDDLDLPLPAPAPTMAFGKRERHLLRRMTEAAARGTQEWVLTDDDVRSLTSDKAARLPDAVAVMATLTAKSNEALARRDFRVHIEAAHGPSGARLLGRFCLGDPDLRTKVEGHLREEEAFHPDAIFAELVHLPEGRVGNILGRPVFREWEIAYLGRGGAGAERTLGIDDLRVSIRDGRIVLRSRALGRRVIPRMTTAHNYGHSALGIYGFLCTLQHERSEMPRFSWGALDAAPFLPRVVRGRVVLSPARWTLFEQELALLGKVGADEAYRRIGRVRAERALPRWVGLVDGDNVLPVDLEHPLHVASFAQLIKARKEARLVELPSADDLVVEGPDGRFAHELVVPLVRTGETERETTGQHPAAPSTKPIASAEVPRRFVPGSEWLYAKVYTGTATADSVLVDAIEPLVTAARAEGLIRGWFFLRYADPQHHLRIRFRGEPRRLAGELLPRLQAALAPLLHARQIWRLQLDTYEREVERYGGRAGIELAEHLFEADSDAVLSVVASVPAASRPILAVRGAFGLLAGLGLDLRARARVASAARASYAAEHRVDGAAARQLGTKFREMRPTLDRVVRQGAQELGELAGGALALDERTARLANIAGALRDAEASGALEVSVERLASSFVHMHINRMLRSEQRAQELVIWEFLERLYDSDLARARKS